MKKATCLSAVPSVYTPLGCIIFSPAVAILRVFLVVLLAAVGTARSQPAPSPEPAAPASAPSVYPLAAFAAIGSSFAHSNHLDELGWNADQTAAFLDGVRAAVGGKGYPFDDIARQVSAEMGRRVHEAEVHKKQLAAAMMAQPGGLAQYMKATRKRFSLQQSDSGLAYSVQPGQSAVRPRPGDTVVVSCRATASDGTTPLPQLCSDHMKVKLDGLLPGLMEGIQMMTVEGKATLVLPPALSFGESEWPQGVDRGMPIIFFVTLHEVTSAVALP